jgi:S-DNA-T family DNA segregation ATPase FtsK/SpoIIIE
MSDKGNKFRKNRPIASKNAINGDATPTPKNNVTNVQLNEVWTKTIKIIGLFLLIMSVCFLIAFTSYLFTWEEDQSYISMANGGWSTLKNSAEEIQNLSDGQAPVVQNWMGKMGALLAHQFIYKWFGIASYLFMVVLFVLGYRLLFKVQIISIWKVLGYSLFFLVFLSVALGFIQSFSNPMPHFLEGEFGFWTNRLLVAQIGVPGVAGALVFALLTALIIIYNLDFKVHFKSKASKAEGEGSLEEGVEGEDAGVSAGAKSRKSVNERFVPDEEYVVDPVEFDMDPAHAAANDPIFGSPGPDESVRDGLPVGGVLGGIAASAAAASAAAASTSLTGAALSGRTGGEIIIDSGVPSIPMDVEQGPELSVEKPNEEKPSTANQLVEQYGEYDPKLDLSGYQHPSLDLLKDYGSGKITINNQELEDNKNKIVETLGNYNIEIAKIKATIGPTVTLYEIIPKPGVRISKIKNLEDDIALSLAALGIRIIAPMPGKGTIGIEVPNSHPEMVSMRSVLATEKFQHTNMDLPIALGKTISNEVYIADLTKMPHLLVAGATGQGKSVGINAILTSLLYKKHPAELKFVLVDPKKVELSLFKKIERHFLAKLPDEEEAIITDTKKVINTLNSLCLEMDLRYDLLKNAQVRNLKEYNAKFVNRRLNPEEGHRYLPFIVLIIDEFADLMMTAGKEVENPIARLAQLARAVGIHLVIATQRPSVNIITGTIKANFPARLAFRVLSKVDSRTILDSGGADQLIGRGDMLLATGSDLIRIQCAFVDTPEVEAISDYIGSQRGYPTAMILPEPEYADEGGGGSNFDISDRDAMFEEAARLVVMHQQGSTSLIQRKLKLGYNRAGRIIDQLESAGIVGPFEGSKAREVLFPDEYSLEQFLESLNKNER